jgi:two-component system, chemotaxis family, sensor kinase CheA
VSDDFLQDPQLLQDFVVESEEALQRMDQDMVALESAPSDGELLNRIFRSIHTIKGTSSFLSLDPIVQLSHRTEDVLNALRRGDCRLTRRMMDALLGARDQLGRMLVDLRNQKLGTYPLDDLLHELELVQQSSGSPLTLGEILVANKIIPRETLDSALTEQANKPEKKLGEILVEKGQVSPVEIGEALSRQRVASETQSDAKTMRVDVRKLDDLINLVGELVLERNRLVRLNHDLSSGGLDRSAFEMAFGQSTARLSFVTGELQNASLKTRMVPIESVFRKFPRLVRDVARSVNKQVQLVLEGQDTEIDRTMVELIADPLVHLVRNSLDHGIELPEIREQAGKPREGTIRLEACQEGDQIVIRIADDGAGINPDRILAKALEKGLVSADRARTLSQREILDFIFLPGFSTAQKVNDLSGRGVGMDVVRSNLQKLNGLVELESEVGRGTTFRLRVPLTLAILSVLLVEVCEEAYALPLRSVLETVRVRPSEIHRVEGCEVLQLSEETVALLRLGKIFGLSNARPESAQKAVILGVGRRRVALLVDRLIGQESTVIKPLGVYLRGNAQLAGATISGDGRVRLVLDPAGLLAAASALAQGARA